MPLRSTCAWAPPSSNLSMSSPVPALTSAGPARPMVDWPRTMAMKSASPAKLVGAANPAPSIAAAIGAQPERRANSWKVVVEGA